MIWVLLFADDFDLTAEGPDYARAILAFVWWLRLFRIPLSWKKTKGGKSYTWVGYEKSLSTWTLGVSETRAEWLGGWLSRTIESRHVNTGELGEALGRMVFVYGALQWDKPFLGASLRFYGIASPGQGP